VAESALEAALDYRQRGWSVVPVWRKGPDWQLVKHTRGTSKTRSFKTRPADEDEIRRWFERNPGAEVGVMCGEASNGLVVVDVDKPEQATELRTPPTPRDRSRRGRHYYTRSDNPPPTRFFPFGELRGEGDLAGAIAVVPPSRDRRWEIGPDELPLAPFESIELPPATSRESSSKSGNPGSSSLTLTRRSLLIRATSPTSLEDLSSYDSDYAASSSMSSALGIDAEFGQAFRCVIHPENSPSASVWCDGAGQFFYRDWHEREGVGGFCFAQVRARLAGRWVDEGPELAVWKLRLLYEAGLVVPAPMPVELEAPPLWCSLRLLYGLRWLRSPGEGAPLGIRFLAAWSGLGWRAVSEQLQELRRSRLLVPAGRHGHYSLWLPHEAAMPANPRETRGGER
jgi:hypothetical protein